MDVKRILSFMTVTAVLLSCDSGNVGGNQGNVDDYHEIADNQNGDVDNPVAPECAVITIPFEFHEPEGDVVAFNIDEGDSLLVKASGDFMFEVLKVAEYEDKNRTVMPVVEYREEYFALSMEAGNVCKVKVFKQEEPFVIYNRIVVFYTLNKEYLEKFSLIIDENAADMEY